MQWIFSIQEELTDFVSSQVTVILQEKTSRSRIKKSPQLTAPVSIVAAIDEDLQKLISDSINDLGDENGWVYLGVLGNLILKKKPDFDPRNYGYKKLIDLIKEIKEIAIDERETGKNNISHFYVKTK